MAHQEVAAEVEVASKFQTFHCFDECRYHGPDSRILALPAPVCYLLPTMHYDCFDCRDQLLVLRGVVPKEEVHGM